jgi:hypothetical protein
MSDLNSFGPVYQGVDVSDTLRRAVASGGKVRIPNLGLRLTSTVVIPSGVHLEGEGDYCTALSTYGADFTALILEGENNGLHDLAVYGCQTGQAANEVVRIRVGAVGQVLRDCRIWGGSWGLATSSVDIDLDNCFVQGTGVDGGNVVSNGAGWYNRLKCDDSGQPHKFGFWQQWNGSSDVAENHFVGGDFTGNFTDSSICINDQGNNSNITVFEGCVNNHRITLYNANWTAFLGHEFGADVIKGNGDCSIGVSKGLGAGIKAIGCRVGPECVGISV